MQNERYRKFVAQRDQLNKSKTYLENGRQWFEPEHTKTLENSIAIDEKEVNTLRTEAMNEIFQERLNKRLKDMGLGNVSDAQHNLGPQLLADIKREIRSSIINDGAAPNWIPPVSDPSQ